MLYCRFYRILLVLQIPQTTNTETGTTSAETAVRIPHSSLPSDFVGSLSRGKVDIISIQPEREESGQFLGEGNDSCTTLIHGHVSDDYSEMEDRFKKYSSKTRDFLKEIFGENATTKSDRVPWVLS